MQELLFARCQSPLVVQPVALPSKFATNNALGPVGVLVAAAGVFVAVGVLVGGTAVFVLVGVGVAVLVAVGAGVLEDAGVDVLVAGTGVLVGVAVLVGGSGVSVCVGVAVGAVDGPATWTSSTNQPLKPLLKPSTLLNTNRSSIELLLGARFTLTLFHAFSLATVLSSDQTVVHVAPPL